MWNIDLKKKIKHESKRRTNVVREEPAEEEEMGMKG
jgi:hypothetical protein